VQEDTGALTFRAHDLLFVALAESAFRRSSAGEGIAASVVRDLFLQRRYDRMFAVLEAMGDIDALVDWVERAGYDLVLSGSFILLRRVLSQIPVEIRLQRPRLLLVSGAMLRQTHKLDEALSEVQAACRLVTAASHVMDPDSILLLARLQADLSRFDGVAETLKPLLDGQSPSLDDESRCLARALMALSCAHLGLSRLATDNAREAERLLASRALSAEVQAHALNCCAFVYAYALSDTASSSRLLSRICALPGVPLVWRLQAQGNLATLLYESGRLHASIKLLQTTLAACEENSLTLLRLEYLGSLAAAFAGRGDYDQAETVAAQAIEGAREHADEFSAMANQMMRIAWRRACGRIDDALEDAETADAAFGRLETSSMQWLAALEVAACRLVLKEENVADETAVRVRQAAAELGSAYHLLRADMILAEIERQRGEYRSAVDRIAAHTDYITTESSNWQIAMYLRAFPGLLSVFSEAVGAERLPAHMLRMVLPEPARLGLDMARTILDPESFKTLAVRTLGLEDAEQYLAGGDRPTRLKVGFFGGLSVTTPQGSIQDSDWRKRKSRLLFAMLVARRGEDIPKDLLFERLWPEMDEDRAKSNFYVIWSAMRRVLCSDSQTGDCPYVEHRAGVCRAVADRIVSDLDEFDAITADLRAAERARNIQDAIEAGERLCMVYHGDVLPGDLYDDWFGPLRERYRDAFGDAMLLAAELAADGGQTEASLRFIRAGLAQDLWREDLYQAALRYQIGSGQRSSAIETYFACRSKLADDLGLDPSAETQRLYEQVLAMEPAPSKVGRY
jgi:DNA-binding SARP family transcriptional activator